MASSSNDDATKTAALWRDAGSNFPLSTTALGSFLAVWSSTSKKTKLAQDRQQPAPAAVAASSAAAVALVAILLALCGTVLALLLPLLTSSLSSLLPPSSPLDHAEGRRAAQLGFRRNASFYADNGVYVEESFLISRGVQLFSKKWLPLSTPPRALIIVCHGYGDTITYFLEDWAVRIARGGMAVAGIDYEGHGLSDGLHVLIQDMDLLVGDVLHFAQQLKTDPRFLSLPFFLYGESMGGAVALKAHLRNQVHWQGAVLLAPMCAISPDMMPPWIVVQLLSLLASLTPTLQIVPVADVSAVSWRDYDKYLKAMRNPVAYHSKPRLRTALELLKTTRELSARMHEINLPLLILHGSNDRVTDPNLSKVLVAKAIHEDKTLQLYEGANHGLTTTELEEVMEAVMRDIETWLMARVEVNVPRVDN